MRRLYVIVSGAPGSGKTTLARALAQSLDLPLLEKDTIKEAIANELGARDITESKRLGAATMRVLVALARINPGAVIESTWERDLARRELSVLERPIIEVFCDVPPDLARRRYVERTGTRHPVHFDAEQGGDVQGWIDRHPQVIDGGWPVIRVDTTKPVDIAALADQIRRLPAL